MLEPYALKSARTVLRGGGEGDLTPLPDYRKPYMDAALTHPLRTGAEVNPEDMARLSPLGHEHINVLGRYSFALAEGIAQGELRPLRHPDEGDDLTVGAA